MTTGLDAPCHPTPEIMLHLVSSGFGLGVNESEDNGKRGRGSNNKSQQVVAVAMLPKHILT